MAGSLSKATASLYVARITRVHFLLFHRAWVLFFLMFHFHRTRVHRLHRTWIARVGSLVHSARVAWIVTAGIGCRGKAENHQW